MASSSVSADSSCFPVLPEEPGDNPCIMKMCSYIRQRFLAQIVRQKCSQKVSKSKFFWGGMPPDPPSWRASAR